ncbi:PDZ domain-containing protein [Clostridium sp.]|uniref:PDZ domain-containing protein n=1 Tax=Clostridium sp. TaxID=1506 RepID=UPI00261AB350|nr:PDZ domain-containing protein [Clostridium sp.]
MELILYTLRMIAYAIVEPTHVLMIFIIGGIFYFKNRKISAMQKITLGESINSPLELTLSQLSLGIIAGAIGSVILTSLGIVFNENSGIEFIFLLSILLLFIKKRYICFSYSGAVLGALSIIFNLLSKVTNTESYLNINILTLMTFIGVMHLIEGVLIMIDGSRGAIPVFSNKDNKIVGGYAYNRYWALPVAILIAMGTIAGSGDMTVAIETPNWWPLINKKETLVMLSTTIIASIPFYGALNYSSISFTKDKTKKPLYSGTGVLIYGISLIAISQLASFGLIGQIIVIIYAPLAHEIMIKIQNNIESKGKYLYITDEEGIMVLEISKYSAIFKGGLRRGDKVLELNNDKPSSEIEILKMLRSNIDKFTLKVKKISGEIVDLTIRPEKNSLGVLFVPNVVEESKKIGIDKNEFKKVLEEMKRKH